MKDLFLQFFLILSVMILECVVVKSYRDIFQPTKSKKSITIIFWIVTLVVPYITKSTFGWTFDVFWVFFLDLGRLQYNLSSHFCYIPQMHLNYMQLDLTNLENLKLWCPKKHIVVCFHPLVFFHPKKKN